jgi:acetyltransferase-like isoleucine patch superfamily enzyme
MGTPASETRPFVVSRALTLAGDHQRSGQLAEAEFFYRQVLDSDPRNVDALYGLATARLDHADHEEAAALLEQALHHAPGDERLRSALTDVRAALRHGRFSGVRRSLPRRLAGRVGRPALQALFQRPRIWKYRALSTCDRVSGSPRIYQPVLFLGEGEIVIGEDVQFGWRQSPLFYTGYCHLEASRPGSSIEFGDRVEINNNATLKSEGPGIRIGANGLFGAHVEVFDSDFHDLHPQRRWGGVPRMAPVDIGPNVFVGMSVKILKGVSIGADSVIGAGAVVTSAIPAGVVAAGNPARVVREL